MQKTQGDFSLSADEQHTSLPWWIFMAVLELEISGLCSSSLSLCRSRNCSYLLSQDHRGGAAPAWTSAPPACLWKRLTCLIAWMRNLERKHSVVAARLLILFLCCCCLVRSSGNIHKRWKSRGKDTLQRVFTTQMSFLCFLLLNYLISREVCAQVGSEQSSVCSWELPWSSLLHGLSISYAIYSICC